MRITDYLITQNNRLEGVFFVAKQSGFDVLKGSSKRSAPWRNRRARSEFKPVMSSQLEKALRQHAEELGDNGERYYRPADGQSLEHFQFDVERIERYEGEGLLEIVGTPHRESQSGQRYVDNLRLRLTPAGVDKWRDKTE